MDNVMTPERAKQKGKLVAIAAIDERELALRMAEAAIGIKRNPDWTKDQALAAMPADWGDGFRRAARAAMEYWRECLDAAQQPH